MKVAIDVLRRGGVVVFPTETAYAIGCDATNSAAVRRILRLKGRRASKKVATISADMKQVERFFVVSDVARRLVRRHWPGPFTIVLPVKDRKLRRALGWTVGVRVSSHATARALARGLGRPIVATSANRSGQPTAYSIRRAVSGADLVINAGTLPRRKPSTVVQFLHGRVVIHRP